MREIPRFFKCTKTLHFSNGSVPKGTMWQYITRFYYGCYEVELGTVDYDTDYSVIGMTEQDLENHFVEVKL